MLIEEKMGNALGNSYISELTDSSGDESESTGPSPYELTTDAAIKTIASFPKPEHVLSLDILSQIEKDLDTDEIVSLVFLLFEETHYALQELVLKLQDSSRQLLYRWAVEGTREINWQKKMIEVLCIIKNYKILKQLGYNKADLISHYLPYYANSALYVDKMRKAAYIICEKLTENKTLRFLDNVKKHFLQHGMEFERYDHQYLELYFLRWEEIGFISRTNMTNVKKILKVMDEDSLYDMLDEIMPQVQNAESKDAIDFDEATTSRMDNDQYFSSLNIPSGAAIKNTKTSTSVDNHIVTENNFFYESQLLSPCIGQDFVNSATTVDHSDKYPIDPDNPGTMLIINQENFYTEINKDYQHLLPPDTSEKLESRKGTEKDRDDLKNIFLKFGFNVIVENNLTHIDMVNKIKEVMNNIRKESSLFVCILSHGDRGIVYGANSCRIKVSKIQQLLCKTNKTYLQEKPKILILQSCQGQQCQKINESSSDEDEDDESYSLTTDSSNRQSLPRTADLFTFWATVPGYAAIRHKKTGSWFIQALCKKLEDIGNKQHFADICTSVVNEVTGMTWSKPEDYKNAMTPMVVHTLRKPFYLPPMKK